MSWQLGRRVRAPSRQHRSIHFFFFCMAPALLHPPPLTGYKPCAGSPLRARGLPSRRPPSAARLAAAATCSASRPAAVVILPGLGNASGDYGALVSDLAELGLTTRVAGVRRIDWARNAAGIVDKNYWAGTLSPTPTVNWCDSTAAVHHRVVTIIALGFMLFFLCNCGGLHE